MESRSIADSDYTILGGALRRVEFFTDLSLREVEKIFAYIKLYAFRKGETIFKQGQAPDGFYVLKSGKVAVTQKAAFFLPGKELKVLGPGDFFGEMALLSRKPRSATVKAIEAGEVFVLLISDFDRILEQNTVFRDQIKHISESRGFENQKT